MEMTGSNAMWIWVAIIGACIGVYYLYKQGKLPWLKKIKLPKMFEPKPDDLTEKLKAQTEKEMVKAEELRKVLEAKTESRVNGMRRRQSRGDCKGESIWYLVEGGFRDVGLPSFLCLFLWPWARGY